MKVFLNKKKIGEIHNGTYYTDRTPKYHFYVKEKGYPLSTKLLLYLQKNNVMSIHIREHTTQKMQVWASTVQAYLLEGKTIHEKPYDEQKIIPLKKLKQIY